MNDVQVFDSRLKTVDVLARPSKTPTTLCESQPIYTWVLVRNLNAGGDAQPSDIWLAFDPVEIAGSNVGQEKFVIPAGQKDAIMLAPNQKLVALSIGGVGQVSVARSIALTAYYPQVA